MIELKTKVNNDWDKILNIEYNKPYFQLLYNFLVDEYNNYTVYPEPKDIYNAFTLTPFQDVKVVILGQDPYHGYGQSEGLAFSVPYDYNPLPPSLRNIFKELQDDLGVRCPNNGSLRKWAKQGVFLLNTVLTVREGKPNSHKGCGWEIFTDNIIRNLSKYRNNLVFILWGNNSRCKKSLINTDKHSIIESPHPSPFSAYNGFFGSKPFSRTNKLLKEQINWVL